MKLNLYSLSNADETQYLYERMSPEEAMIRNSNLSLSGMSKQWTLVEDESSTKIHDTVIKPRGSFWVYTKKEKCNGST